LPGKERLDPLRLRYHKQPCSSDRFSKRRLYLSDILRDLKRHTSKAILEAIQNNPQESRREWMLWIFKSAGKSNTNNKDYQFWQQDNRPIL
jgi:hypothetical protein